MARYSRVCRRWSICWGCRARAGVEPGGSPHRHEGRGEGIGAESRVVTSLLIWDWRQSHARTILAVSTKYATWHSASLVPLCPRGRIPWSVVIAMETVEQPPPMRGHKVPPRPHRLSLPRYRSRPRMGVRPDAVPVRTPAGNPGGVVGPRRGRRATVGPQPTVRLLTLKLRHVFGGRRAHAAHQHHEYRTTPDGPLASVPLMAPPPDELCSRAFR